VEDGNADDEMKMLTEALARARRLVAGLEREQAEAERAPREGLTAEQLAAGREALENAVASARRMLAALEEAYEIALDARRGGSESWRDDGDSDGGDPDEDDPDDGRPVN
jgi:hypothetical protein